MFIAFKEFDDKVESFQTYLKSLEQNFVLHNIKNEKNVAALLSCMGLKLYGMLCDLRVPKDSQKTKCKTHKLSCLKSALLSLWPTGDMIP